MANFIPNEEFFSVQMNRLYSFSFRFSWLINSNRVSQGMRITQRTNKTSLFSPTKEHAMWQQKKEQQQQQKQQEQVEQHQKEEQQQE